MTILICGNKTLDLTHPQVMGILNVTPDSFSDGGRFNRIDQAIEQALLMEKDGAAIVDVGGESTRPGAEAVSLQVELDRTIPVIEAIAKRSGIIISIDTQKPEVMKEAVLAGASMVNDVNALRSSNALTVVSGLGVPICLMHMQGSPERMQDKPEYGNVVDEVVGFLNERVVACEEAGIANNQIIIDPGFGFGKKIDDNLSLLKNLKQFEVLLLPVLVGISNKSMLGQITGREIKERTAASLATAVLAVERGANILRVHDVGQTVDVLKITKAVLS